MLFIGRDRVKYSQKVVRREQDSRETETEREREGGRERER
jgi:hypothetical protein